jgi:hypothetical protein
VQHRGRFEPLQVKRVGTSASDQPIAASDFT